VTNVNDVFLIETKNGVWLGRELNPRHEDFQSSALPTELPSLLPMKTPDNSATPESLIDGMLTL
jgi:hypothetical protein